MSPFVSPKQQIYLKINHPEIHDKWYKEHGNAPGLGEYIKKHKKRKKAMENKDLVELAQELDKKGQHKLADKLDLVVAQMDEIGVSCKTCGQMIGKAAECESCGWKEALLCPNCTMKKLGNNICPDCGDTLKTTTEDDF